MQKQEIVAALIDGAELTTSQEVIDASLSDGRDVELISRSRARRTAAAQFSQTWAALAQGPTLYLLDCGSRFRACGHVFE